MSPEKRKSPLDIHNEQYCSGIENQLKKEQHLMDMRNLEEINKKLKEGFIFLTTVHTNDTVLALLEKRN